MLDLLFVPAAIAYLLVIGALFAYGLNFFYLTYLSWTRRARRPKAPPAPRVWPYVTVQLPIYNERYVAKRLLEAAGRLDYPLDRREIQVLDDSTDDTVDVVRQTAAALRRRGLDIQHVRRRHRKGFKAGALAEGMACAKGELLAVFDADFVPPPDFLRRTVPHFADPKLAFVQTRWGHVNRDYSALTLLQSIAIDAHFAIEQFARHLGGYWFNFNGSGGIWRRQAIHDAGGWTADTLTEDLDLSYRASLRGWHGLYLGDLETPAELPASFSAYRRQQHRWARGSLECARKLLPRIWRAQLPLRMKLEASLHLTGYGIHLLLFALAVLYPLLLLLNEQYPSLINLFGIGLIFNATAFAPLTFFLVAQRRLGRFSWRSLPKAAFLMALGTGMMVNTFRAALDMLRRTRGVFERTPKFGIVGRRDSWLGKRYQLRLDPIVIPELGFALLNATTIALALERGNWLIAVYAGLFCVGLLFTAGMTAAQTLRLQWSQIRLRAREVEADGSA